FELLLDEFTPDVIGFPNCIKVVPRFGCGNVFEHDSVQVHERRDAHVRGAMDENASPFESVHDSTKRAEILRGRSLEINRDLHVRHTHAGNKAALVWKRVVGCGKCEIDDGVKASFMNQPKLCFCGLSRGGEFIAQGTEVINFG